MSKPEFFDNLEENTRNDLVDDIVEDISPVYNFYIKCSKKNERVLQYLFGSFVSFEQYSVKTTDNELILGFNLYNVTDTQLTKDLIKLFWAFNASGTGYAYIIYASKDYSDENCINQFYPIQTLVLGGTTPHQIEKLSEQIVLCNKLDQVGVDFKNISFSDFNDAVEVQVDNRINVEETIVYNISRLARKSATVSVQYQPINTYQLSVSNILQHTKIIFDESNETYKSYLDDNNSNSPHMDELILGKYNASTSSIYLYPKNIDSCANSLSIESCGKLLKKGGTRIRKALYGQVFLHELAHAIMDETHEITQKDKWIVNDNRNPPYILHDKCFQVMEESLANHICLSFIESIYGRESLDYRLALEFIDKHQPDIYKFGIKQHTLNADWNKWLELKRQGHSSANDMKIRQWYQMYVLSQKLYISPFDEAVS